MDLERLESCLREWPPDDLRALKRALDWDVHDVEDWADDDDDLGGLAAHWSDATLDNNVRFYTYWLRFLRRRGELEPLSPPGARVSPARLIAYVKELRRVSPVARVTYVRGIRYMLLAIDRDGQPACLAPMVRRLVRTAEPVRDQSHLLVAPSDMFYAGLARMDRVLPLAEGVPKFAGKYRDGLMMSAIVCKALRRRNFAGMLVGRNISRNVMDVYEVRFRPVETKARREIRAVLSALLTPYIDRWFKTIRPLLLRGRTSDAMWITMAGADMSPETLHNRLCNATEQELSKRINPHLTRKIVYTGVAIARPELIRMVGSLLDQSSDQSDAYNLADQLSASRRYLDLLEERRQLALRHHVGPNDQRRRRRRRLG